MNAKSLLSTVFFIGLLIWAQGARAQGLEARVERDNQLALELLDLGEGQAAADKVQRGLNVLADKGLALSPVAARSHVLLGVILSKGLGDDGGALTHFRKAAQIDRDIELPGNHRDEITKSLFEKAYGDVHPTVDCSKLLGVAHEPLVTTREGAPTRIEAKIGKVLQEQAVVLVQYRGPGGGGYAEAPMKKLSDCTYQAEIPQEDVVAPKLEYYLLAKLDDGRPAARRGKAEKPFVVNVAFGSGGAPQAVDEEPAPQADPIDEVPDELQLGPPKAPKGSGCAGCASTGGDAGGLALLAIALALFLRPRRVSSGR